VVSSASFIVYKTGLKQNRPALGSAAPGGRAYGRIAAYFESDLYYHLRPAACEELPGAFRLLYLFPLNACRLETGFILFVGAIAGSSCVELSEEMNALLASVV
jgi:hypothetical protein